MGDREDLFALTRDWDKRASQFLDLGYNDEIAELEYRKVTILGMRVIIQWLRYLAVSK